MLHKNRKGSGADLLLEIILSSIIFFIIVIFLFAIRAPQQLLRAEASVVSADAAMSCELSLTNLLRANSSEGISYNDWLINSYVANDKAKMDSWKANVKSILDKTLSDGYWNLTVTNNTGKSILSAGQIKEGSKVDLFGCSAYVPYPAVYTKIYCFWSGVKDNAINDDKVKFDTPDGTVNCQVIETADRIGFVRESTTCNLDLKQSQISPFLEDLPSSVENDPNSLDEFTLPILVGGVSYKIKIAETQEASKVSVSMSKRALAQDCSLSVSLLTTNVSAEATSAASA